MMIIRNFVVLYFVCVIGLAEEKSKRKFMNVDP